MGIALILQGLLRVEVVPLSLVSILLGIDSSSPFNFFVYPFLYFILRFLYIPVKTVYALKFYGPGAPLKIMSEFFGFLIDFFTWVISFWLMGMIVFLLIAINYIPNKGPQLFFVILNLFIGLFIILKAIRTAMPGHQKQ